MKAEDLKKYNYIDKYLDTVFGGKALIVSVVGDVFVSSTGLRWLLKNDILICPLERLENKS